MVLTFRENIATIKCMTCRSQLELGLKIPVRWGGARRGSGRKAAARPRVWHRGRAEFPGSHPGLVTIRVLRDVPSLRTVRLVREVEHSLRAIAKRADFRVVHYSLQHDHVHLLVESEGAAALSKGMKSLAARLARAVNRVFGRRGAVLDGRYHHRALGTPREVRTALAYVLLNARKHAGRRAVAAPPSDSWADPASSGRWFEGWAGCPVPPAGCPAVARARTWLLATGWRRHGLIRCDETPGVRRGRASAKFSRTAGGNRE
jgi:REP element-mobilizing transposase RayT